LTNTTLDTSRPLQLSDGTPVTFDRIDDDGRIAVRVKDRGHTMYSPGRRFFNRDGSRPLGSTHMSVRLMNVSSTLDVSKPLTTRSGLPVTYLATVDNQLIVEIVGGFNNKMIVRRNLDGSEIGRVTSRGTMKIEHGLDIINKVAVAKTVYRNVYAETGVAAGGTHNTMRAAELYSKVGRTRIGILTLTTVDGEVVSSAYRALQPYFRKSSLNDSVAIDA
jgi:hypothetical protein